MKKKDYIIFILGALVIGLVAYIFWQSKAREPVAGNIASDSLPPTLSVIRTMHPARRTFTVNIPWIGIVEPQASIKLTALVAGRVESIDAEDESPVEKGDRIMQLGGPQIEEARARLTTEIESLKTQVKLARETLARLEEGLKPHLATRDQVAAAQEAKVRLEAQLRDAQLNLRTLNRESCITAPINGVFTNRRVSVGQDVTAGQVVGSIIDRDRLRIKASLFPPSDLELQGRKATVRLREGRTITGVVSQVLPTASSTGAVMVWIQGSQIDTHLHPGQTVEGSIVAESRPGALAVPKSAIVYDAQERPFLFVRKGGSYERVAVQTGVEQGGWVEVLSGLKADQLVVVRGAYELFYRNFNEQFKVQD